MAAEHSAQEQHLLAVFRQLPETHRIATLQVLREQLTELENGGPAWLRRAPSDGNKPAPG